jgi:hypothetical protein
VVSASIRVLGSGFGAFGAALVGSFGAVVALVVLGAGFAVVGAFVVVRAVGFLAVVVLDMMRLLGDETSRAGPSLRGRLQNFAANVQTAIGRGDRELGSGLGRQSPRIL